MDQIKRRAILPVFLFFSIFSFSQGEYAGPVLKKFIGKTFANEKNINGLKGYEFREGSLITDVNDPAPETLDVLLKGNKGVVVFAAKSDTSEKAFQIVDIIEIKNIPAGWEIKTIGCQEGETEGEIIVALVNPGKGEYVKTVKLAWRCNRDKLRFETISTKNIKCINEGQD